MIRPAGTASGLIRRATPEADARNTREVDPDCLEHTRREALDEQDQPDLPWDT